MSGPDQNGLQQRNGYSNQEGYTGPPPGYTEGPPPDGWTPQDHPVQQSYEPQGAGPYPYQGDQMRDDEYVDKKGRTRKKYAGRFAAGLALCWCITWPCHGPCCGGL